MEYLSKLAAESNTRVIACCMEVCKPGGFGLARRRVDSRCTKSRKSTSQLRRDRVVWSASYVTPHEVAEHLQRLCSFWMAGYFPLKHMKPPSLTSFINPLGLCITHSLKPQITRNCIYKTLYIYIYNKKGKYNTRKYTWVGCLPPSARFSV